MSFSLALQNYGSQTVAFEKYGSETASLDWCSERNMGQGCFGKVWVQTARQDTAAKMRAIKVIRTELMYDMGVDYRREMVALTELTKSRV